MNATKKRGANATEKQKSMLVEYMRNKPELISGKFKNDYTFKDAAKDWQEVADSLNSMPGAQKDWKGWRKAWQDLRSRTKCKQIKNVKETQATGGGTGNTELVTDIEEDILDIIKKVSVEGHNVPEPTIAFDLNFQQKESVEEIALDGLVGPEITEIPSTILQTKDVVNTGIPSTSGTTSSKKENETPKKFPNKIPKKLDCLINSAAAATEFERQMKLKNALKENYYDTKIKLLKRGLKLKARKVKALESIANTLKSRR